MAGGAGSEAQFSYPSGVAVAASGEIWVADAGFMHGRSYTGRTIRRIGTDGVVLTVAGRADAPYLGGAVDGVGSDAHFGLPSQIAIERAGTLLVADGAAIRRVTPEGAVTTVASIPGATRGVAVASDGSIFASDLNGAVWQLATASEPRLVAGNGAPMVDTSASRDASSFRGPTSVTADREGNAIVADVDRIVRVMADGRAAIVAPLAGASPFARLGDVAVSADGTIWATDIDRSCVWRIATDGTLLRIGGEHGWFGWADGPADEAMFFWPRGIAAAPDGTVWVADTNNHVLRRVTPDGVVSTLVGEHGVNETRDGAPAEARFNHPVGIDVTPDGEAWVTESHGRTVRLVTTSGAVVTIAGAPGVPGDADGKGSEARFGELGQVSVDARGRAWVADTRNAMLRVVERGGSVTSGAGGPAGFATFDATSYRAVDGGLGANTRFIGPTAVAFTPDGRLLVADEWAHALKVGVPCFEGKRCGGSRERPAQR